MSKEQISPELMKVIQRHRKKTLAAYSGSTMSVRAMAELLGLHKTDSYWLIDKHFFKTVQVNGKTRVVTESFEKWYDNQLKYRIIGGPPPGKELCKRAYTVQDISEMLGIDDSTAYRLVIREKIPYITVDYVMMIKKGEFESWYKGQARYRTCEDRARDEALEESSMTMPEMARLLGVPRQTVYGILNSKKYEGCFDVIVIADRKRITKESFEKWYASQDKYRKAGQKTTRKAERPIPEIDLEAEFYTAEEAATIADVHVYTVYRWIKEGKLAWVPKGLKKMIRGESLVQLIEESDREKGEENGVDC